MQSTCEYDYVERFCFIAEWWDPEGQHLTRFFLNYFPYDNSVELWEKTKNKLFLRRALVDGLQLEDMYVGNTIRVYGRQLTITEYADEKTKNFISKKTSRTLAILKPNVIKEMGPILRRILNRGFRISHAKMCNIQPEESMRLFESKKSDAFLPFMIEHLSSGPILALELVAEDAVKKWLDLMGLDDPVQARRDAPDTLRAIYGQELVTNGFHGSSTQEEAENAVNFFFPKRIEPGKRPPKTTAKFLNSTCGVIKPHAIIGGIMGDIISDIHDNGFKITAMEIFYLSNSNAEEFLEVYKGVVGDFNALMLSYIDGPCCALEVGLADNASSGRDVHKEFRAFCGPSDPDVARQIRPHSLRAKYGVETVKNAIHCTDLPEDTELELEYFFQLLEV